MKTYLAKAVIQISSLLRHLPFTKGFDRFLIPRLCALRWLAPSFQHQKFYLPKLDIWWSASAFPDIMTRTMLVKGLYQDDVIAMLTGLLPRSSGVFLDVGAHHGLMSIVASKLVSASGSVIAFEPNPQSRALLQEHLALNHVTNVVVVPLGLSDKAGLSSFYAHPGEYSWNSTFIKDFADQASQGNEITVETSTLDAFCQSQGIVPSVIKIDTEGSDFFVLKGGVSTIRQFKPHLIIEFNPISAHKAGMSIAEISAFLLDLGYRLYMLRRLWNGGYHFEDRAVFDPTLFSEDGSLKNVLCLSPMPENHL